MTEKVTIHLDGTAFEVDAGSNLLEALLKLKIDMPYFCWHPSLGSAGSCRQCAVLQYQNAEDTRGRLVMSCMTPVSEGMIVSMETERAVDFRATAIEAIMTNHPHDCPVCEEGGDCHLQDMTLMSGHINRQYPGTKRTHLNQYLGPLLNHEMNRCIGCYRCVRFYRDHCGGDDLNVFASRNRIYFGRVEPGVLQNEFSGNLAEVCPTGVFTDKTFSEHYTRKWDLQTAPSVCTNCSVGCNTYSAERDGMLRRITNRYNPQVNDHFLCDRGRFGYEYVNHSERLEKAWLRNDAEQKVDVLTIKQAQSQLTQWFSDGDTVAVGSARSSIENNAALLKLASSKHFYSPLSNAQNEQLQLLLNVYQHSDLSVLSLKQIEACDATLLVGDDPTHNAPRVALSIRQMTRNAGIAKAAKLGIKDWQDEAVRNIAQDLRSPLHIVSTHKGRLNDVAKQNCHLAPNRQLALLLEVESLLNNADDKDIASKEAVSIFEDLQSAENPAIITSVGDAQTLKVCLRIAQKLNKGGFYCTTGQANALGLAALCQLSFDDLLTRLKDKPPSTLIVMETDLYRYTSDKLLDELLNQVEHIVVLEQHLTRTAQMADLVLPAASAFEAHGCWLNAEGRVQKSYSVMPNIESRQPSSVWLQTLTGMHDCNQVLSWLTQSNELFNPLDKYISQFSGDFPIARMPLRASSRTAIKADIDVKEYPPAKDSDSQMTFSQEGVPSFRQQTLDSQSPPTGIWQPKWNSGQGINKSLDDETDIGIRLFDHTSPAEVDLNGQTALVSSDGVKICAKANIYADDELASYSSSLQQLQDKAAALMSTEQANALGISTGQSVTVKDKLSSFELPCVIDDSVAQGVVLIPAQYYIALGVDAHLGSAS